MYLKKLEIHGFKSFADKTTLEFQPGIILVVGPNGSGKSNIADAIRWVLGEQSVKSLRGGKMEDVIFAGSDKRRSLGMAEVSLTVDNTSGLFPLDFNEITVTRRLYRSGESDYLINRVACRLRDIHELFMDTGVGREGISIIGQGKIDEILSVKAEERRIVLEDAAGIVKYRHRKKEAARKLEDTEQSLVRLSDIIGELTEQEGPLHEQAGVAAIYKTLKEELDNLEIGLIIDEAETARRRLVNVKGSKNHENQDLEESRSKFLQTQSREEEHKLALQKNEEKLTFQQEKVYSENLRLEKSEGEKKLLFERISDLNRQEENTEKEILHLKGEYENLKLEHQSLQRRGEDLQRQLHEKKAALKEHEELVEEENWHDQKLSEQLEALKSEHFDALQEETKIHNDLNSAKQRQSALERQEEQLRAKYAAAGAELENITVKLADFNREASDLRASTLRTEERLQELQKNYYSEEKTLREAQKHNRCLLDEKNNALARQKILSEMEREGQGYAEGVKEILRQKSGGGFPGIIGTVAQVIAAPKAYELAVEVVLGGSLQHILTENDQVAQEAIQWLKSQDKGRVTFLPLNTIRSGRGSDKTPRGPGVIGCLSDLIEYDGRFKNVIEYLLGRVWLVQDLACAVKEAKATDFRFRMVTLDGQLVNAGGSLTGGSIKPNPSGILSRKRNIEELAQNIQKLDEQLLQAEKNEKHLERVLESIQKEINRLKERLQNLNIQKAENNKTQERWEAERDRYKTELESYSWQLNELQNEKDSAAKLIQRSDKESRMIKDRISGSAQNIQDMQERVRICRLEQLKKNQILTQLRIEVATVEEKTSSFRKEEGLFIQRIKQLEQQVKDKKNEIEIIKEKREVLEKNYNSMESAKEVQVSQLQELDKELDTLKKEKQRILEDLSQVSQEVKKYSSGLREKEEKLHQLELQESKYELTIEAAIRRMAEQYDLDWEEAAEKYQAVQDRKKASLRITELKEEVACLGQVNLGAIDEYARVKERLDFLNTQVKDMSEARERLLQVIGEMDQIMGRKFKETFTAVDKAFQDMFNRLFGGGRAQLILTQPDDILETGVEIIAQPPGKKTQFLSLLSGGEKALTGIALLMAILKVKPSPFCLLDEIESNLDEANVVRLAHLLKEFAQQTQFIVISHNKGTMETAHLLYGVTIDETGVSRLLSVRLEDAQQEAS